MSRDVASATKAEEVAQAATRRVSEILQGWYNDLRGLTWWGYGSGFMTQNGPNSASPDVLQSAG